MVKTLSALYSRLRIMYYSYRAQQVYLKADALTDKIYHLSVKLHVGNFKSGNLRAGTPERVKALAELAALTKLQASLRKRAVGLEVKSPAYYA